VRGAARQSPTLQCTLATLTSNEKLECAPVCRAPSRGLSCCAIAARICTVSVRVRVIDGHKLNAAVHQRGDERQITAEPVKLGGERASPCGFLQAAERGASCGRSARLPLSTSVKSALLSAGERESILAPTYSGSLRGVSLAVETRSRARRSS
jgi:hypothetical protein